ncbi:MAG: hypothetical protein ACRD4O_19080 [Bryobacteraceae bacterium]
MKKKAAAEPIIAPEILELAKRSLHSEKPEPPKHCAVCGAVSSPMSGPNRSDDLCWVCRRLKISAWRDSDQQLSAPE